MCDNCERERETERTAHSSGTVPLRAARVWCASGMCRHGAVHVRHLRSQCACFVVPVPVLYCGTHVTCRPVDDCHVRHGRVARLLAYGWAGNGTSRGCGDRAPATEAGSACTTGTGDRFHSMSIHSEVTPASHSACYVLQEGVPLNNSVIAILCNTTPKTANARTVDGPSSMMHHHDLFASKRRRQTEPT
jgi:hypothetical protein